MRKPLVSARRLILTIVVTLIVLAALTGTGAVRAETPTGDVPLREADQAGVATVKVPATDAPTGTVAPLFEREGPAPLVDLPATARQIPGQYIVVLQPGAINVNAMASQMLAQYGGSVLLTYEHALQGFSARLSEKSLAALRDDPAVAFVEPDQIMRMVDTQTPATWGLDRIDQRNLPLNNSYIYNQTGAGVHAYIVDTGMRLSHNEFTGRVGNGFDAIDGGTADDCNGHGTHVAGTVGGTIYGVAKSVTLHPVRVLNCSGSGSNSQVIAGVDWVTANHVSPSVANMSLGGGASNALDNAVSNSINSGVTYAIAGGNSNANACNYSPARVAAALTVGATTNTDARASYSNYGTCLDLFAPGSNITSAWYTSNSATNTISGTSMATPHVAGVAALYLQVNPASSPAQVGTAIVNNATSGVVSNPGAGSPNRLLYSLFIGGPGPTPTATPPGPTPTATAPPGGNVFVNPGFESGPGVGWSQYSAGGYQLITTDLPRSGSYSAYLGGYNNAVDFVYQRVTIPAGGQLSYWWQMQSQEFSNTPYDIMDVRIYNGAGQYAYTLRRFHNGNARNVWSSDSINLSPLAGYTVYIVILVDTDGSLPSSFFVDDFSLN